MMVLMERWGASYESVMTMPYSRRRRLLVRREDIDKKSNPGGGSRYVAPKRRAR